MRDIPTFPCKKHGLKFLQCRECRLEYWRAKSERYHQRPEYKKKNRIRCNQHWKRWSYGISEETIQKRFSAQDSKCALCKTETSRPCVDHIHGTKIVRGILCTNCNAALGMAKEDPALLRAMADYLEKFRGNREFLPPLKLQI